MFLCLENPYASNYLELPEPYHLEAKLWIAVKAWKSWAGDG